MALACVLCSSASHIVGGNVTYTYLGGNQFRITFKVYRDCDNSVQVGFDGDSARIGQPSFSPFYFSVLRSDNGTSILPVNRNQLYVGNSNIRKVTSIIINDCVDTNQSCVEEATYSTIITVLDPSISHIVMSSRCCRNGGIANLDDIPSPQGSNKPGLTIYTTIPPINSFTNNSAVFKKFPPLFICNQQQFYFDHSATDSEGDQLKYYLVQPLDGGTANNPMVQIGSLASLTNYADWKPPFSLSNIISGSINLAIDSNTGLMTGFPSVAGRYVVSVLVKEFRGGVVLDSAIRDFQFNVNACDLPNLDLPVLPGSFDPNTKLGDFIISCKGNRSVCFPNPSSNSSRLLWKFGDPSTGTSDTSTSSTPCHTYSDTGTFIVTLIGYRMQGNKECVDTIRRRVKIIPPFYPKFTSTVTPSTAPLCAGTPISFTETSTGNGTAIDWQWQYGDGNSGVGKTSTHTFVTGGTYLTKLILTTNRGCTLDTTMSVQVKHRPTINATVSPACLNQPISLVSNVTIPGPATIANYRWTLPGNIVFNTADALYTPTTMQAGVVNLYAKSDEGCENNQDFTYTVNPLPAVIASNDVRICYDQNTVLNATGAVSYVWTPATYLNNVLIQQPTASPPYPNSFQYIVEGTDAKGCKNKDSVTVSFYTKPFIYAGADTNVCLNISSVSYRDSVRLTGQGSFSSVSWSPTAGLNSSTQAIVKAKPSGTTDYIFTGIDPNNCQVKDTVNVVVLDPNIDIIPQRNVTKCYDDTILIEPIDQGDITSYFWTPNNRISNQNIRTPLLYNLITVDYVLEARNYCYNKFDTITVTVPPKPVTNMIRIDSTCFGKRYLFNLNPTYSYQWSTSDTSFRPYGVANPTCNPSITTTYYITATDANNCKDKDSAVLKVYYPPALSLFNLKPFLCLGDSMSLEAYTSANDRIEWSPNQFITDTTKRRVQIFAPESANYNLRAYSAAHCFTDKPFRINVQKPILPVVQSPSHLCFGSYVSLYASGGLYYYWSPAYNIKDTLVGTPQVYPDTTMRYQVRIANDCFDDTTSVLAIVDTLPKVKILMDTTIYRGTEVNLKALTSAITIEWTPKDDLTNPFGYENRVSPLTTTDYIVQVRDGNFCYGYDTAKVTVIGKNILLLPTAFSPNGDQVNDYFGVIKYLNVKKLNSFKVFDRWGGVLFSAKSIDDKWDGTASGKPVPAGTYTWEIEVYNFDNERVSKSGIIQIIR